jgi:hypothetical protein
VSRADLLLACVIVRKLGPISSQTLDNALNVFQQFRKIYVSKDAIMSKKHVGTEATLAEIGIQHSALSTCRVVLSSR